MELNSYDALIGAILPLVVGFLTARSWPGTLKSAIAVGLIVITAVLRCWLSGTLDFTSVATALTTIGVVHQASYELFTKYFAKALQSVGPVKDAPIPPATEVQTNEKAS